ncbi:molybdenum ABC transporter ATP-binding protein ModC [Serratia microhaemolytica]|uniref:molybdenum ABC transporter ATP-binding protein ModC n=1 Tax=Serratia microhaemolytica TaxID=2675110 RepID=UPI000FDDE769|nr:molybdenum ABC transporter ATP-binding protein ModC [Serratia microhaemolytica]
MLQLDFSQQLGELNLKVQATLPAQGITAIFGLSGAGKTSLINAIAGLTPIQQGKIVLNGRPLVDSAQRIALPPEQRRVGYVFQDARLFPHYRVRGNLQYGMAANMQSQFETIVELLGIAPLLERQPLTLSGGEKQRVAIGRALLSAPELLLLDEPLASLDLPRKRELLPYLERLARDVQIPMLYVSHSLDEIVRLATHLLVLDQGSVLACGELATVWNSSALLPWLQQQERSAILSLAVAAHHPYYAMTALQLGEQHLWLPTIDAPIGSKLHIRINATDVSLLLEPPRKSSIRNTLAAEVVECIAVDDQVDVKLMIAEHMLWARISRWARDELAIQPGQSLYAQLKSVSLNRDGR